MQPIADLQNSNRITLIDHWKSSFGALPPIGISQELMRHILANQIQIKTLGDLDAKSKRALRLDATHMLKHSPRKASQKLQPGARLIREWNGETHSVDITDEGLEWRGQSYKSLSAIARAITGAHWSGPRFFGLDKRETHHV